MCPTPPTPGYLPFSVLVPVFVEHKASGRCNTYSDNQGFNHFKVGTEQGLVNSGTSKVETRTKAAALVGFQSQRSGTHNAHGQQISFPLSAKESECSMSFRTWSHLYGRTVGQAGPDLDHPNFPREVLSSPIRG